MPSRESSSEPIRVALIGLSASAKTSWAAYAHLPYLREAEKEGHYKIVALLNSSKEAAEKAIKTYGLDASVVRPYGSPEALAKDDDVDLVVVNTRVDLHWPTVKPSIEAGKSAFIEWPLAKSLEEAREVAAAAHKASLTSDRIMIGLQNRLHPAFQSLDKYITSDNKVGKVHSVDFRGTFGYFSPVMSATVDYFNDAEVGGNMLSIYLFHQLDSILFSLGDADIANLSARLLTGHKKVDLVGGGFGADYSKMNIIKKDYLRDTYDQIMLHGRMKSSKSANVDGALITVHVRGDNPFKDEYDGGASLRIYGEKGEIHLSSPASQLTAGSFKYFDRTANTVEDLKINEKSDVKFGEMDLSKLNPAAQSTGRLYERFRLQKQEGLPRLDVALRRHELIESIYKSNREGGGE
jgi:predicted dehydrogenase